MIRCPLLLSLLLALMATTARADQTRDFPSNGVPGIRITTRENQDGVRFFLNAPPQFPLTLTVRATTENLASDAPLPYTLSVHGARMQPLFELRRSDASRPWRYRFEWHWLYGDTTALHEDAHAYRLPYPAGEAFELMQGYNGSYSHQPPKQYAYDFRMPEGTPVLAARNGVVVDLKSDSSSGGPDRRFADLANYVVILHEDGSLAWYLHLKHLGVTVARGDQVAAGDLIGQSGNTGFTSTPHLHFEVYRPQDGYMRRNLPVRMAVGQNVYPRLVEGHYYRAGDSPGR